VFENHDHEHYKTHHFADHFGSSPVHEEYVFPEESAAVPVTPPVEDVLKIAKPAEVTESIEHVEIVQV
jgi:hypothetical protein